MDIRIVNKSSNPNPIYGSAGAAACDIQANLPCKDVEEYTGDQYHDGFVVLAEDEKFDAINIFPGGRALIPTGLYIEIPNTYHADIRPRSGLALKHGITVLNTPGCIDEDYRGEIGVLLHNTDTHRPFLVKHGMKIAQLQICKTNKVVWIPVKGLNKTERGEGGYGSTDVKKEVIENTSENTSESTEVK